MAMARKVSRGVLLRVAVVGGVCLFYYTPLSFLQAANGVGAPQRVTEIRLWLSLLATVVAMVGVISTPLLIVACVHAALHLLQALAAIPLRTAPSAWCWQQNGVSACGYEYGSLVSFFLMARYVLLPPPSTLASMRRHSRQLKRFFQQHDRKYVSLVDRLLEDYAGNERLLFARIRKIYRTKAAPTP